MKPPNSAFSHLQPLRLQSDVAEDGVELADMQDGDNFALANVSSVKPDAVALQSLVEDLAKRSAVHESSAVSLAELSDAHSESIATLNRANVVTAYDDEFGERRFALNMRNLSWSMDLEVDSPVLEAVYDRSVNDTAKLTKFEIMCKLTSAGWREAQQPPPLELDKPRCFAIRNVERSHSYWLVMLHSGHLLQNGISVIFHDLPKHYYDCLLQLPTADATTLSARQDLHALSDKDFLNILRGRIPAPPEELALCDGDDDAVPIPTAALVMAAHPTQNEVLSSTSSHSLQPTGGGHQCTVRFDGWSHSSGHRRAYTACQQHPECFKYRQIRAFPNEHRVLAYMWWWSSMGPACATKREHLACEPSPSELDHAEVALFGS